MQYGIVKEAVFLSRPNRFIAETELDGQLERVHVKNTGRCRELLVKGARVFLCAGKNPARETKYDLIAVYKGDRLINMDSQAPNAVFYEYLQSGGFGKFDFIKPEYKWGGSRFDFYAERAEERFLMEVKGVTLEENGRVYFPDAPTERGERHVHELIRAAGEGYKCSIVFVVQMENVESFSPNTLTHPAFGEALKLAKEAGVGIYAFDCRVEPDKMTVKSPVRIIL